MPERDVVLLTGYPSFLARATCAEILRSDPTADIRAIVRAKFAEEAQALVDDMAPEE